MISTKLTYEIFVFSWEKTQLLSESERDLGPGTIKRVRTEWIVVLISTIVKIVRNSGPWQFFRSFVYRRSRESACRKLPAARFIPIDVTGATTINRDLATETARFTRRIVPSSRQSNVRTYLSRNRRIVPSRFAIRVSITDSVKLTVARARGLFRFGSIVEINWGIGTGPEPVRFCRRGPSLSRKTLTTDAISTAIINCDLRSCGKVVTGESRGKPWDTMGRW